MERGAAGVQPSETSGTVKSLMCWDPFSSPCFTSSANTGIKIWLLWNTVFGRKEVPSFFWDVHTWNTFGKKKILHTCTPAHSLVHLADCSSVTSSTSHLIYNISNSILMSIFQGLLKHQWPYPMSKMGGWGGKKKQSTYWQQSTKQRYAKPLFLALPVLMPGNKHFSGHLFPGFVILCCPCIQRHWILLSQYICKETLNHIPLFP